MGARKNADDGKIEVTERYCMLLHDDTSKMLDTGSLARLQASRQTPI
jgi:hypothetical protein